MSFTAEGNAKMSARLIAEKGVDAEGKSLHHKHAGASVKTRGPGYFARLHATPEGRKILSEIGRKAAARSNAVQAKKRAEAQEATQTSGA